MLELACVGLLMLEPWLGTGLGSRVHPRTNGPLQQASTGQYRPTCSPTLVGHTCGGSAPGMHGNPFMSAHPVVLTCGASVEVGSAVLGLGVGSCVVGGAVLGAMGLDVGSSVVGAAVLGVVGLGVGSGVVGGTVPRAMGLGVGDDVGGGVGEGVGDGVGGGMGDSVGDGVGDGVGNGVGCRVGDLVGCRVGCRVGDGVEQSHQVHISCETLLL